MQIQAPKQIQAPQQTQTPQQQDEPDEEEKTKNTKAGEDSPYNQPNASITSVKDAAKKSWAKQMQLYLVQ